MSDPNNKSMDVIPGRWTEAILQELLLENVSSLKREVMELKNQDSAMVNKAYPQKHPCNGGNNAEGIMEVLCNDKDPIDKITNSKGLQDVKEDYNSSDIYSLLEEGEAFMETVFGSKLEYVARKVKVVTRL